MFKRQFNAHIHEKTGSKMGRVENMLSPAPPSSNRSCAIITGLFALVAEQSIGNRLGRIEPRAVKWRPKPYSLLNENRVMARGKVNVMGIQKNLSKCHSSPTSFFHKPASLTPRPAVIQTSPNTFRISPAVATRKL